MWDWFQIYNLPVMQWPLLGSESSGMVHVPTLYCKFPIAIILLENCRASVGITCGMVSTHQSVRSQQDYIPWSGLRPTHLLLSQYLLVVREENISVEEGKNISFAGQWRMYIDTRGAICITTLSNPHKCSSHVDSHNKDKMIEIRSVHCKQTQTDMRKAESFPELKLSITRKLQKGCM